MKKERIKIKVADLTTNKGQLGWLPANPRQWTQEDLEKTKKSLTTDPDFIEERPILVLQDGKKWVAFAGNLRTTAAKELGWKETEVVHYTPETEDDKYTIKRRAMLDNGAFGAWDFDALANEWDDLPLTDWGVPAWKTEEDETGPIDASKEKIDKNVPEVEALLNEAMRTNVRETLEQIDYTMNKGWLCTFITKGLAQAKFIRAKYYGEHYPQWVSLYFCPQRFWTSASRLSCYDAMTAIAKNETDAGIAGLRTVTGDHLLLLLLKGSYPFANARMPMDFPANTAADLMKEFAPGGSVLDPCHGWGGRLVGAMMADASLYVGCDPSREAHDGLVRADEAFRPYAKDTKTEFLLSPFEDADLGGRVFDMAITSPPYFDVEQYHGEGQSHVRYPKYDLWRDGFYYTLIEKTYGALKPGGVFVLQVGSKSYPLLEDGKAIANKVGFTVEDVRPLGGGTASALHDNTDDDPENEKIIILRK